jgi:predicted short-subunit dehydrogenase-like oxidoreductase (DUF2520 family)
MKKIILIGAGNIAQHLAPALSAQGYLIQAVFSRQQEKAELLCKKIPQAKAQNHLDFGVCEADLLILAVSDDALGEVAQNLIAPLDSLIVHTSGTQALSVLSSLRQAKGVFYPLQTFSTGKKVDFKEVPFCIEAEEANHEADLIKIAKTLSSKVYRVNSVQRQSLHLAAVFANNFSNHIFSIAEEILQEADLPFDLLKPLLAETVAKALDLGPTPSQTGPARRQDKKVIDKHLSLLENKPAWKEIYKALSELIQEKYS